MHCCTKTSSVKVKPISGVTNQGGTIVFGGGRTLLHIEEEVQESPSHSTWVECSGIIFSTKTTSNVSTDSLKCGSKDVLHKETTGKNKSDNVCCATSSNVSTSNEKLNADTSPTVSTNAIMSNVEDQSGSWGTPFVPSNIKQAQLNDYNVATIIPNSSVNSNPVVAKNHEVGTDGNKFCFGALSPSTLMSTKDNNAVATIKSCMKVVLESIVNSNLTLVDTTKNSSVGDKTSSFMTTIVMSSKPNETVLISEPDPNVVQVCPTSLVSSNIVVEVHSDGDKSSCLGDKSSDLCSLFS